ncbi:superoxide dismutase [Micromonospora sp. S-DT3-3-22]|uniref:superoxide dismutase n=1 Tax=Micromonospora sp. S-DT3-3-22 TaxID=2755359 RepID=UPI002814DED3|nr:superoxide dismutase [Micromonospora sp. S-DT3-3-22]
MSHGCAAACSPIGSRCGRRLPPHRDRLCCKHSIFWNNLSPHGGDRPDGELAAAIEEHFGSFEGFAGQLSAATKSVQGSGWGVLAWEPLGQRLIVEQVYDHHGNVGQGSTPLLVFDAWEHAYYLQYRNVRPDYVDRLWGLVDWADVTARFDAARATGPTL